jgi:16S rRNA (uracil1498-N3)-methyltransferase
LEKVLISAMKQSLKVFLPVLHPGVSFKEFIENTTAEQKYMAHIGSHNPVPLARDFQKGKTNVVLIGPEGDFTPEEIDLAIGLGYHTVSLGKSRLRTETAGIVACHTISLLENV